MSLFKKNTHHEVPELNTTSMPDLIFSILFFFMIVTNMREVSLKVKFKTPAGTELTKLEKKSCVSYIYIGQPTDNLRPYLGSGTRIQLNDKFAEIPEVMDFVNAERTKMSPEDAPKMSVSIMADKGTRMGVITDVKQALRKSYALKINYSAVQRQ
jgi:biopolymer transport protein ExbD